MRICYFGTYRDEYSRNQIMIEGLRQAGLDVVECHETLWTGIEDRVQAASGGWLSLTFVRRLLGTYWRLLQRYRRVGAYDIMVVGYPGQFDVFLARLLTWWRRRPLVWDIFMSIYLIALERQLDQRSPFTIGLLRRLEWLACRLPDRLILDTAEYVAWFTKTHGVPASRFGLVPTGADDRLFHPVESVPIGDGLFRVLYYGTFIPNHGTNYIIEAAHLLKNDPIIHFDMIGDGPERAKAEELVRRYGLRNISFTAWMEKASLVGCIAQSDVCLGAFGMTPQSLMTVQNKIYEGLAMAKPVISGDSPAVRQFLKHKEHIYLCDRQQPQSLVEAIRTLKDDAGLRSYLAGKGHEIFLTRYNLHSIGKDFFQILRLDN